MKSIIKNPRLAPQGKKQVEWARAHMPALLAVEQKFAKEKPFKGQRIGMALHITKETAVLTQVLKAGGAQVYLASCNPLSTQDDVAAFLATQGITVFGHRGESTSDYYKFIRAVISAKPTITIDDGCDLITEIHQKNKDLIPKMIGGCEETTTGVQRLRAMEKENKLRYAVVAVNDNKTKHLFDNFYGTGQSTIDGILRATNILFAGKTVVVAGYGDCGTGIALRANGMGAHVIVTEIDPVRALRATMDGYEVMKMDSACSRGDVFITATGVSGVITLDHIKKMKSGAILANSGHFNVEIDVDSLRHAAIDSRHIRPSTEEFTLTLGAKKNAQSKKIYLIGEGRLVNLAAAEGHPSEVMDLSFCGQALACEWLTLMAKDKKILTPGVYRLPDEIDDAIAQLKLDTLGLEIDKLNSAQNKYINSWEVGT